MIRPVVLLSCLIASEAHAADLFSFPGAGSSFRVSLESVQDLRFKGVVRQEKDFSCGSAAVATLLTYHFDLPVTETEVFQAMYETGDQETIRAQGFSMLDMKRYLASHGYTADGFRITVDRLRKVQSPAITLIDIDGYKHFVVVKGYRDGKVLVGDPALGLRAIDRKTFETQWSGIMFVIHRGLPEQGPAYDLDADWAARPGAPLDEALVAQQLAAFTLSLPYSKGYGL